MSTEKEEALELGQILGQFVNAAPGPVLKVLMKVMEQAFDEINMREEDWQELQQAIEQGNGQPSEQQQQSEGVQAASPEQLKELLAKLPPDQKKQVKSAIDSGVPPQQALQQALKSAKPAAQPQ